MGQAWDVRIVTAAHPETGGLKKVGAEHCVRERGPAPGHLGGGQSNGSLRNPDSVPPVGRSSICCRRDPFRRRATQRPLAGPVAIAAASDGDSIFLCRGSSPARV